MEKSGKPERESKMAASANEPRSDRRERSERMERLERAERNGNERAEKDKVEKPEVDIRDMEIEDLHTVFALGEKLFTAGKWPMLYRTWDEYELVSYYGSDGSVTLVAELDGKIAGFTLGSFIEKRRSAWSYGYMVWLGVDPDFGKIGIGSKLIRELKERFIELGARIMLVDTDADNEPALQLFRKHGFEEDADHVWLSKNLTNDPSYKRMKKKKDD